MEDRDGEKKLRVNMGKTKIMKSGIAIDLLVAEIFMLKSVNGQTDASSTPTSYKLTL